MATFKSYTDIEQAKKLAEILPLESADMYYMETSPNNYTVSILQRLERDMLHNQAEHYKMFPCWSLAALLSIFDCYEINKFGNNIQFDTKDIALSTKENETILDIVVDTIILLHKQNLL